ncbi:HDR143Cp [Eremothecium sinecaudum]|uniref:HDR143Cp n=1 Tax=Eremothecium sinecaudum TaxID=45286 RepID=A0A0X8HT00_9SACH|nr:HDR143Cp [Eremothecium sinecaudum]AMD20885.1 HDR143Cp [Eremothecium sinecaudum]
MDKFLAQEPLIVQSSLSQLRYLVLSEGVPTDRERRKRCYVWSILSRTSMEGATSRYVELVKKGEPAGAIFKKIQNDTFRTFSTDTVFREVVSEHALSRCLCCFAWEQQRRRNGGGTGVRVAPYVQGMNVLLAPLLYSCPSEAMAFRLFETVCHKVIPTYLDNSLSGVHTGARLLDVCLRVVDPKLGSFLADNLLTAEIYGVPAILTLSSCQKPLDEVCKLWDFMFAYGFHMNILFIVAQLVTLRSRIMQSDSPMNLLRQMPEFDADEIIRLGVGFVAKIPQGLYDLLVRHLTDPDIDVSSYTGQD